MNNFDASVNQIFIYEGYYSNSVYDPGGMTKFGISKAAYPNLDIANITLEQAKQIYKTDYWDACQCDNLPNGIDFCVFDCAVNQGVKTSIILLQDALNITQDGIIGSITLRWAKNANPENLIALFLASRGIAYSKAKNFYMYGKGWLKRLMITAVFSNKMIET